MNDSNMILADNPGLGRVRLCECHSIHLTIGPVTVNLAQEAFTQAAVLMCNAMEQLSKIEGPKAALQNSMQPSQPDSNPLIH